MIGPAIARRHYLRGLHSLERGDIDALLRQFDRRASLTFAGDTPLGASGMTGDQLRGWFERFLRLLPQRRFTVQRLVIAGPPWRMRLAAHVHIDSTVLGEPYRNQFAHFLTVRWGKVVDDLVIEDTQRWARACERLVAAGLDEAAAPPLG